MPTLHVLKVFVGEDRAGGNPLGVFLDGPEIAYSKRQRVAADLGFSETVFVDDVERGELRIFTPDTKSVYIMIHYAEDDKARAALGVR